MLSGALTFALHLQLYHEACKTNELSSVCVCYRYIKLALMLTSSFRLVVNYFQFDFDLHN